MVDVESAGSTQNLWLAEPNSPAGTLWLHKDTLIPENRIEQGEDWSEVVSTQVAAILGVPRATTRLCLRKDRRGSLSRSVRPEDADLWEGQIVLEDVHAPGYFPHVEGREGVDPERPDVKRPGHNLRNIELALDDVAPPPEFEGPGSLSGFDVFAGYLLLDALIANRDRHEQNWAVLRPRLLGPPVRLSPSYDHASSLERRCRPVAGTDQRARSDSSYCAVVRGSGRRNVRPGRYVRLRTAHTEPWEASR